MADAASAPLAIDLFCGLGGWTKGLLAEGWYVVGFDIERHRYPKMRRTESSEKLPGNNGGVGAKIWSNRPIARLKDANVGLEILNEWDEYPAQLVLQDVLTLRGSQFKDASLIVASPPCQGYSYRAMPWSRAKALPPPDNSLFEACFRIQREAIEAAGHFIPMVVENVRGAQKWVGRARWNFGSYYLWGDVPALMPMTKAIKNNGGSWFAVADNPVRNQNPVNGCKLPSGEGNRTALGNGERFTSMGNSRKHAAATIAKIPLTLSRHIGSVWKP